MDIGVMLYNSLKDVTWSTTSLPLDRLVNVYKLPQIVKLDSGESQEGLRENDYILIHSSHQWTTITAHSLEEGHYVIGPKIEIPVHYEGQFKLLEQDRDINEPVQYFSSVEDVAKAFPERVYVMEDITFSVKVASGECNEDTEVYNITLSSGDELTLMGQAEILYAKTSKEKSRFNTIFKKIGKLNSVSKLGHGKMPCLICMNHRTNESVSLPFQCRGRFSTRSPLELQLQQGEHTIRNIVEKTRLPVNVTVPSAPPRNQHDHHFIREGHHYKLVNIQTKTVVVCCVLRSNSVIPIHFPLHLAMPRVIIPKGLQQNELWLDTIVHRWFSFCQEQFDIDDYSRAVRDVRADWSEDSKSPKKSNSNGGSSITCALQNHVPSSLTYARDDLTRSFHRLSVCVYGNYLHGNNEVNLQGHKRLCGDWALFSPDAEACDSPERDCSVSEAAVDPDQPALSRPHLQYEELWLEKGVQLPPRQTALAAAEKTRHEGEGPALSATEPSATLPAPAPPLSGPIRISDNCLPPPPVPPKSDAVKEECRLLNAPPVPPRAAKPQSGREQRHRPTRSPSPTLSYYSPGLHTLRVAENVVAEEQAKVCHPCKLPDLSNATTSAAHSAAFQSMPSRMSWPNNFCGSRSQDADLLPVRCRSYYSYPRQKAGAAPAAFSPTAFDFEGRERSPSERSVVQCVSCPALPPRLGRGTELLLADGEGQGDTLTLNSRSRVDAPPHPLGGSSAPVTSPLLRHCAPHCHASSWQPPINLVGLSVEEVSKSLRFIGLSEDIVSLFAMERIDGSLLLQLTEEILSEDFKLNKLQVKKLMQFIGGWRPKI
ncbi:hypothetical protein AGOR_G00141350 [Albula goreensis]|uniref:CABIT domain-containing protein n=1 Tax=Albula goreensis TaxID=1534307 RepID=A0A8T3D3P3_9TELE|nr:hypothetical protein AGOR_G00141350 [Albula goreensis]